MAKNLLAIVQEVCARSSLPIPTGVQSNEDPGIRQMFGLLQEFLEDCITRKSYQVNTIECTFISIAAEDQGDINTICPYGYQGIISETFFDRTQMLPIPGGISAAEWQARKAFNIAGPLYQYRLRGNKLLFSPALPVTHTIAFEYMSSFFVRSALTPTVPQQYWVLDTDTCVFDDALPLAYLRWAFKKEKGLDYAEDFAKYEKLFAMMTSRDGNPQVIDQGARNCELRPGIFVPAGSWAIT